MNITQDNETSVHVKLVGVTASGHEVDVTGITLSAVVTSGSPVFTPDATGGSISDSTVETYTLEMSTDSTLPLEADSAVINGTVVGAPTVALRIVLG